MTPADILPWLSLASLLISIGTSVTIFLTSGAKATAVTVRDHETRIQQIENLLPHLPNKDGVHKQQLEITEMKGDIGIIKEIDRGNRTDNTPRRGLPDGRRA